LDWRDYPSHLDLAKCVRHIGTANHFVATSLSITQWVEGSKRKPGQPGLKFEARNPKQARIIEISMSQTDIPANDSVSII
jgi:hypothetical protein